MQPEARGNPAAAQCELGGIASRVPVFTSLVARNRAAKERLAHLARTIEADVIPRLVEALRTAAPAAADAVPGAPPPSQRQVSEFVTLILGHSEERLHAAVDERRRAGASVESLYLDLFTPAARLLGQMWSDDECDFASVTVGLGRLQRLLRELSPAFGNEVEHPANGRRALFAQPADEQHADRPTTRPSAHARNGSTWSASRSAPNAGSTGCAGASPRCARRRATPAS